MPAVAAHFKFGQLVFSNLDDEIKKVIANNKDLFDLATQGPDLLFYYNPIKRNTVSEYGHTIHAQSAEKLFGGILNRKISKNPDILAYVLGVICHYCLDVACHPFVNDFANGNTAMHTSLESDFDLTIINKYDMVINRKIYIPADVDYAAIAAVYLLTSDEIRQCTKSMKGYNQLLNYTSIIKVGERFIGKTGIFSGLSLKKEVMFIEEMESMVTLFNDALKTAQNLVTSYYNAVKEDGPLPDGFEFTFDGVYEVG